MDDVASMVKEIAEKRHFKLKVGCIYSDVDKSVVLKKYAAGLIEPCGQGPPPLQKQDIEQSTNIVAQIGSEPYLEMLSESRWLVIFHANPTPSAICRRRQRQCDHFWKSLRSGSFRSLRNAPWLRCG